MAECSPNRWKTLWEKEILLVTSNFSFSYSVLKKYVLQTCKNQGLFGKGLIDLAHSCTKSNGGICLSRISSLALNKSKIRSFSKFSSKAFLSIRYSG